MTEKAMGSGRHALHAFVLAILMYLDVSWATATAVTVCDSIRAEMLRRQVSERKEATNAAYDAEALGNTKHQPYLRVQGTTAIVLVGLGAVTGKSGDLIHPMKYSDESDSIHWIDTIWVQDQAGKIIGMRQLGANEKSPAAFSFPIPNGTLAMTPYEHCNKHGLFKGQTVAINPQQTVAHVPPTCRILNCSGWASDVYTKCDSFTAEYERQAETEFSKTSPVDGNTNLKHKPSLVLNGDGSATVTVGLENVGGNGAITYHPMQASSDPDSVHWINAIWVKDQSDTVIAMHEFSALDPSPATFTFEIPLGTTDLQAFEFCNKHGLFQGDQITVGTTQTSQESLENCTLTNCRPNIPDYAKQTDCLSLVAEAKRKQEYLNLYSPTVFTLPFKQCDDSRKHCPFVVLDGKVGKVVVGEGALPNYLGAIHPMVDDPSDFGANIHFIETIWVEDQDGKVLTFRSLSPSEASPATLYFDIPVGTTKVRAYEFCNKHGLFQGPEVVVLPANTNIAARTGCSIQQCLEGTSVSSCQAFVSEFHRQEGATGKDDPSGKHKPFLWIDGTTATIVVGEGATPGGAGGLVHPMSPSSDENSVHFITHIWARDEFNNLVALCELLPTDPAPASCTFEVPPNILFLRPYEFCNKHGLYVGAQVPVQNGESNPTASRVCHRRECTAAQPSLSSLAITSAAVLEQYENQQESLERISSYNMCLEHKALFAIPKQLVNSSHMQDLKKLVREGTTASDGTNRLDAFRAVLPLLLARGGEWHALPDVKVHTGINDTALRLNLIDMSRTVFSMTTLASGNITYAEGVEQPIAAATGELLLIEANFGMHWGYDRFKALGPHYTIFYHVDFTAEVVDVALCAKTQGWMGIGWLTPNHNGHYMRHTDMVVAYVDSFGQAFVEDRFAQSTEEPLKDETMNGQRQDDLGSFSLHGENDLMLRTGALGVSGKEWCADSQCKPGFSIVQFTRNFQTPDKDDLELPSSSPNIGMIHAFAKLDPTDLEMVQHIMTTTGYVDLQWNLDCAAGYFYDVNTVDCEPCDTGTFRPATADVFSCIAVARGTYQNETAQSVAKPCPAGFTTLERGSKRELDCVCPGPSLDAPRGRYHLETCVDLNLPRVTSEGELARCAALGKCEDCPVGMLCNGGKEVAGASERVDAFCATFVYASSQACTSRDFCLQFPNDNECEPTKPIKKKGYYVEGSIIQGNLEVFQCPYEDDCPASADFTKCAPGWTGRVCWNCDSQDAEGPRETQCERCPVWAYLGLPVALIVLYLIYRATVHSVFGRASASYMLLGNLSVALVSLQSLNVLIGFVPNLPESLKWLVKISQIFVIRIDGILPGCVFGESFAARMAFKAVPWVVVVGGYMVIYCISQVIGRLMPSMTKPMDWDKTLNAMGLVLQCLFVSFAMECVTFYVPLDHPSAPNTLVEFPNVVAWSSEHMSMIWLHIVQLLLSVVAFFSYVCYICMIAAGKVKQGGMSSRLLKRNAFILARWRPGWFVWGVLTLLRNMFLCLVPAVVEPLIIRSLFMTCLIVPHALMESFAQPWRTSNNNLVDIACSFVLAIMALLCTSLGNDNEYQRTAALLLNAAFGVLVIIICASFPYAIWSKSKNNIDKRNEERADGLAQAFELSRKLMERVHQSGYSAQSFIASFSDYDDITLRHFNSLLSNEVGDGPKQLRVISGIWGLSNSSNNTPAKDMAKSDSEKSDITLEQKDVIASKIDEAVVNNCSSQASKEAHTSSEEEDATATI